MHCRVPSSVTQRAMRTSSSCRCAAGALPEHLSQLSYMHVQRSCPSPLCPLPPVPRAGQNHSRPEHSETPALRLLS